MSEWSSFPGVTPMQPKEAPSSIETPQTLNDLQVWIRDTLKLPAQLETSLLAAIDAVFIRHERLWQESKSDAIRALSAAFSDKLARAKSEILAREATVSSISRY